MNIVLVGNPNVGKSVIFNALTGKYVTVSNYPGTTVEVAKGVGKFSGHTLSVIDTPGVNSLTAHSEDEKVTKDILSRSDISAIVQVADSKNMKRSLLLTLELMELNIPLVLNLNMSDEAKERGIKIDIKKLSEKLGIDVAETIAITGEGIPRLKEAILKARPARSFTAAVKAEDSKDAIALLNKRGKIADNLIKETMTTSRSLKRRVSEIIGRLTIRPLSGMPILFLVLTFMYLFVGKLAAGRGVDFFENILFGKYVNPAVAGLVDNFIHIGIIKEFLIGEYGIVTMAITYSLAIIFPIVTAFFLFFGVLEDSGYLPRLSILSDRIFKSIGLNGRAILPIILGLGCGTMATLTARILDTKKERILVTLLLTLAIPCSAQLGVIIGILGALSAKAAIIWLAAILFVMVVVGYTASRIIPGARSPFIQEIPPIRMPQISNIVTKTFARLKWYLKEAVPLFILGTIILFICDKTGVLRVIEYISRPVIVTLLGLPGKVTQVFILGFLRRDYGAAGLYALSKNGLIDGVQTVVSIVVITLFMPCIAQFFVTIKERGVKTACAIATFVFIFSFFFGGLLNFMLRYLIAHGVAAV
ncbi:MAG: hypothetical protein A3K16_02960 [Omnitrophica bacterium RIFCSPLOWO2_01_FULL_45_24]|nr:MAG: hypothetical protein A3C51_03445 [Omnitrophica bacterium RIFCSPHIGHO2_02_FULL_46_20]OGW93200.1 MAG: hypothetical protein A3G36_01800 [Omnitrophica bacterium RIFCSPLOWO2_12_FULL_45_13]OGW94562.1 MAG: hypothetical protein A3K16_02960 [Omnitrophica bacterium RIFCSPLOWO2_01_FULL_45_24]